MISKLIQSDIYDLILKERIRDPEFDIPDARINFIARKIARYIRWNYKRRGRPKRSKG